MMYFKLLLFSLLVFVFFSCQAKYLSQKQIDNISYPIPQVDYTKKNIKFENEKNMFISFRVYDDANEEFIPKREELLKFKETVVSMLSTSKEFMLEILSSLPSTWTFNDSIASYHKYEQFSGEGGPMSGLSVINADWFFMYKDWNETYIDPIVIAIIYDLNEILQNTETKKRFSMEIARFYLRTAIYFHKNELLPILLENKKIFPFIDEYINNAIHSKNYFAIDKLLNLISENNLKFSIEDFLYKYNYLINDDPNLSLKILNTYKYIFNGSSLNDIYKGYYPGLYFEYKGILTSLDYKLNLVDFYRNDKLDFFSDEMICDLFASDLLDLANDCSGLIRWLIDLNKYDLFLYMVTTGKEKLKFQENLVFYSLSNQKSNFAKLILKTYPDQFYNSETNENIIEYVANNKNLTDVGWVGNL